MRAVRKAVQEIRFTKTSTLSRTLHKKDRSGASKRLFRSFLADTRNCLVNTAGFGGKLF